MSTFTIDQKTPILIDFTPGPGLQKTSLKPADLAKKSADALDRAMNTIHHMAQRVTDTMDALTRHPSEIEVEFGIKLDAESGALIAKVGAEASLNVKMTWKRK